MAVIEGYTPLNLRTEAVKELRDLSHDLSAKEHVRVTLSETLLRVINSYRESETSRTTQRIKG